MGIGRLQCHVIDVNDLAVAEAFWSEVTGLPVIPSVFPGRCSYLGQPDPWRHEVILHLVRTEKGPEPNRSHVDIWVRDVDRAIEQVEAIGGRRKRSPSIYPRPGSYPGRNRSWTGRSRRIPSATSSASSGCSVSPNATPSPKLAGTAAATTGTGGRSPAAPARPPDLKSLQPPQPRGEPPWRSTPTTCRSRSRRETS